MSTRLHTSSRWTFVPGTRWVQSRRHRLNSTLSFRLYTSQWLGLLGKTRSPSRSGEVCEQWSALTNCHFGWSRRARMRGCLRNMPTGFSSDTNTAGCTFTSCVMVFSATASARSCRLAKSVSGLQSESLCMVRPWVARENVSHGGDIWTCEIAVSGTSHLC